MKKINLNVIIFEGDNINRLELYKSKRSKIENNQLDLEGIIADLKVIDPLFFNNILPTQSLDYLFFDRIT